VSTLAQVRREDLHGRLVVASRVARDPLERINAPEADLLCFACELADRLREPLGDLTFSGDLNRPEGASSDDNSSEQGCSGNLRSRVEGSAHPAAHARRSWITRQDPNTTAAASPAARQVAAAMTGR
jgi:hypothetical protein